MFTNEDIGNIRALKTILNAGEYPLKGDAILKVASLFVWFDDLERRAIQAQVKPIQAKPVKKPIKKIGSK